jgi:hypothetical protein
MPWQLQPLIWPIIIATLALLAVPRPARPQEPSPAVRAACEGDIKRLCPKEHAAGDGAAIAACMRAHAFSISRGCVNAWLAEQSKERKAQ